MRGFFIGLGYLLLLAPASLSSGQAKPPAPPARVADDLPQIFNVARDEVTEKLAVRMHAALQRKLDWDYSDTPLSEVAADLSKRLELPFALDQRGLDEVGVTADTPVTFQAKRLAARTAVKHFLSEHGILCCPRDGRVMITNPDAAPQSTQLVPIAPLAIRVLGRRGSGEPEAFLQFVQELFTPPPPAMFGEEMFATEGPLEPGRFAVLDDRVLSATLPYSEQVELERFIAALHQAKQILAKNPADFPGRGIDVFGADDVRAKLERKIRFQFSGTLGDMAEQLSERLDLPVLSAARDLDEFGVNRDSETQGEFVDLPARHVLRGLLRPLGLTFLVTPDAIVLSNPNVAAMPENLTFRLLPLTARRNSDFPRSLPTIELAGRRLLVVRGTEEETEELTRLAAALRRVEDWELRNPEPAAPK